MTSVVAGVLGALSIVFFLCFIRVWLGPTLPDRVIALDLSSTTAVALLAVYAIFANEPAVLDAALMGAFIGFLGVVAFGTHIARQGRER